MPKVSVKSLLAVIDSVTPEMERNGSPGRIAGGKRLVSRTFLTFPSYYTAALCRKVNVKRILGVDSEVSIEIDQCLWAAEYKFCINQSAVL